MNREDAKPEQEAALIGGATDVLVDVLNKARALTFVMIQGVEMAGRGVGGLPVEEDRRRADANPAGSLAVIAPQGPTQANP